MTPASRPRVLIAGGGIAGLETLLALRALAGRRVDIDLLSPQTHFVHRPRSVGAPFEFGQPRRRALADVAVELGAVLHGDALVAVDPHRRAATTASGAELAYDHLVVAVGAHATAGLPGAIAFHGHAAVQALRDLTERLERGDASRVVFALPDDARWPIPLYELALLMATRLADRDAEGVELTVVTPEAAPLELFGAAASDAVREALERRGITVVTGATAAHVDPGHVELSDGTSLPADAVVTLPRLAGPAIEGLPHDARGFIPVDDHARVRGVRRVFAAGDGTDQPIKQGGLACQQADAAASVIAGSAGAPVRPAPVRPVLRALLLTGGLPLFLRADGDGGASVAAERQLWWPPGKIAGRYLAPYLDGPPGGPAEGRAPLEDREPAPSQEGEDLEAEHEAARDLALTLADEEAKAGDTGRALEWLNAAEQIGGTLPADAAARRTRWAAGR